MNERRGTGALVKLANGRVLAASGLTAELYDPATNRWTRTGPLPSLHNGAALVALGDSAIIAGGAIDTDASSSTPEYTSDVAVFNPAGTGSWAPAAPLPSPQAGVPGARA